MKSLKTLLTCGMLLASTAAFAQFSNAGGGKSTSSRSGSGLVKKTDSYSRFYVGYNPMTISPDIDGEDDVTLHGVGVGFTHGFSLSKTQPIFLEIGVRGVYNLKTETDEYSNVELSGHLFKNVEFKTSYEVASVSVPVNLTYKLSFGNGDVSISPFLGITLKGNVLGKKTVKLEADKQTAKKKYDLFDKKDVTKDGQWKRFQAGWQIGANLDYKKLTIGLHYGSDFGEICKKTTTSNWSVSLGYNF